MFKATLIESAFNQIVYDSPLWWRLNLGESKVTLVFRLSNSLILKAIKEF